MNCQSMIMWSNHSFHHWCIFTRQCIILLSSCKGLNLIPTSNPRNNIFRSRLKWSNPLCIFAVNHIIFVCTYVFYFCSRPSLRATSYFLWSHLRCCMSLLVSAVILSICLIIHLHWQIWLWQGKPCDFYD